MDKKIQRAVPLILAICLLLCGCNNVSVDSTESTHPSTAVEVDIRPLPPENPGSSLMEYVPDRKIFITGANIHYDIYETVGMPAFTIEILSKKELDKDKIEASLPTDHPYEVRVGTIPLANDTEADSATMLMDNNTALLYYTYQSYRGVDFNDPKSRDSVYEDFLALEPEDIPLFYVYLIEFYFPYDGGEREPEVIEYVDVSIDGTLYRQELGSVRLLPDELILDELAYPVGYPHPEIYPGRIGIGILNGIQHYNDGYLELWDLFSYQDIQDTMTFTGFHLADKEIEILDIVVQLTSEGRTMEFSWDGTTPIDLYEGDSISLTVYCKNEDITGLRSSTSILAFVEAIVGEEEMSIPSYYDITVGDNYYELYAIVFDGVDVEPYYLYYYNPRHMDWIKNYA